ncbi:MAG: hypothetical protein V8Q30_01185 [Acutalibacteraceae bacterium]
MNCYEPEGRKIAGTANQRSCGSESGLREAMAEGVILEGWGARIGRASPDLLVKLGGVLGVIPMTKGRWAWRTAPPGTLRSSHGWASRCALWSPGSRSWRTAPCVRC